MIDQFVGDVKYLGNGHLLDLTDALWDLQDEFYPGLGTVKNIPNNEYSIVDADVNWHGEIFRITTNDGIDFFFEISGYIVSHEGAHLHLFAEVVPKVRTVTVFE